jgi:hypothetical protein
LRAGTSILREGKWLAADSGEPLSSSRPLKST